MKWIKTAIGAVIAISVVPFVVLSVINIKKSLEETKKITITFEMDHENPYGTNIFDHTLSYDEVIDYVEKGYTITNLYDYTHDITITITDWYFNENDSLIMVDNNSVKYNLIFDSGLMSISYSYLSIYNAITSDIVLMDIILTKNPSKNDKLTATLISFVPIIFVGGIILYFYKPLKRRD